MRLFVIGVFLLCLISLSSSQNNIDTAGGDINVINDFFRIIGSTVDYILDQFPPTSVWDCTDDSQRVTELVGRICDCNIKERNCNPLCPSSYVQCGELGNKVVPCPSGTFFNPLFAACVPPDLFSFLCPVLKSLNMTTPISQQCLSADCFCLDKKDGIYSNPFDEYCQSYIVCHAEFENKIEKVQLCDGGERFNSVTQQCEPAADVQCGDAPEDSCSDPICFCLHKPPGIYDNIFDFEMNSAIECGTCGTFAAIWYGPPDHVFNGKDFVPVPPTSSRPQLCGQITAGIKPQSTFISNILFGEGNPGNIGRRLAGLTYISPVNHEFLSIVADSGVPQCRRALLATFPRNGYQIVPAYSCDPSLRCPRNLQNAFVALNCRMVHCINGCGILASTRNICSSTPARSPPRRSPPRRSPPRFSG